jgi:molybdopterin-containing oxidoreductase family membrane subunit
MQDFITKRHLANAAKVLLVCCWLVAYGYLAETFMSFYSGDVYERYMTINRWTGPYAPVYWSLIFCNVVAPQVLWWRAVRNSVWALFVLSIVVNIGMWMERFLIVVSSLHRDYMPSSWGMFYPTKWDWMTLFGTVALFVWLFLLFVRFLPLISMAEMRELVDESAKGKA